jgi:replicative DNA helicase
VLKRLAKKLDSPVMLLFQLDIDVEERSDKRPTLIDLADAGSLDQDADLVLFIYRDEVYYPCTEHCNRGRAEIIIAKNRRGYKGMTALNFSHQQSLFKNIEG